VPERFTKQERLTLDIGLNMVIPIPDLNWDDRGITCTLSFQKQPFYCFIPWSSVLQAAIVGDTHGWNWESLMTEKVPMGEKKVEVPVKKKNHLRLVVNNG
jgi:hypothetical protein